ncbi:peptidase inhibitor family I36 protein [Streptomyces sp. NPDC020490]|uniref:peptidase inhibitor family I36 protein n=1 Tax=Streptomyces sp. NPDC020490 TaxID=3365078 RepID=UPI0037B7228C
MKLVSYAAVLAGALAVMGAASPAGAASETTVRQQVTADAYPIGLVLGENQRLGGKQFYATYTLSELVGFNDKASSAWNNTTDKYFILYDDKSFIGGNNYCMRPGEYVWDLHQFNFGDKISSVRVLDAVESRSGCNGYRTFF